MDHRYKELYESHCRRTGCVCDHTICFRGWIDTHYETTPCSYCRQDTYQRWYAREQARAKGYPLEALQRIMRGDK